MERARKKEEKNEIFWRIIWPAVIIVIFVGAILLSAGCGGGGGGGETKAENSDTNQNNNQNPPADQNANPPADNTNANQSPDVKIAGLIQFPKTGQIVSYAKGDDGDIQAGVAWPNPRFTDNGDNTITDNLTGLMWTKDADIAKQATNQPSLNYFSNTRPGGYGDWRLPSIYELESLVDVSRANPALPSEHPFFNVRGANRYVYYWTSTNVSDSQHREAAAAVDFSDGAVYWLLKNDYYYGYIWGVRASDKKGIIQIPQVGNGNGIGVVQPTPRFVDNKDGTITDNLAGLMWTKDMKLTGGVNWKFGLEYVAAMNRDEKLNFGYKDWRVPNRKELFYMLDLTNDPHYGIADGSIFVNEAVQIWSSTTVISDINSAWKLSLLFGSRQIRLNSKNDSLSLWPVRTILAK